MKHQNDCAKQARFTRCVSRDISPPDWMTYLVKALLEYAAESKTDYLMVVKNRNRVFLKNSVS